MLPNTSDRRSLPINRRRARSADAGAIVGVFNVPHHAFLGIEDEARADKLVRGIVGKRLTYKDLSPSVA
jgi:hypothetical protein